MITTTKMIIMTKIITKMIDHYDDNDADNNKFKGEHRKHC